MHRVALSALTHGLRWQDAVDVLVLTALFSWAYRWLKHTIAVQVAFGLLTLLAVSWVASHLGLILTSYLLSAVSAVADHRRRGGLPARDSTWPEPRQSAGLAHETDRR